MIVRIFEGDLLLRKMELDERIKYRIGSDPECEIKLAEIQPLEGELYCRDGKWFFQGVKRGDPVEIQPGYSLTLGSYTLRFALPIFPRQGGDKTVVYEINDSTVVINRESNPHLVFLNGEFRGKEVPIDKPIFTIGRVEGNDLVIPDPGVSKRHCRIVKRGEKFFIEDFNSTNGTYLNGERVDTSELRSGDEIEVGGAKLQFRSGGRIYGSRKKGSPEKTVVAGGRLNVRTLLLAGGILLILAYLFLLPMFRSERREVPPVREVVQQKPTHMEFTPSAEMENLETPDPENEKKSAQGDENAEESVSHQEGQRRNSKVSPVKKKKMAVVKRPHSAGRRKNVAKSPPLNPWWRNERCETIFMRWSEAMRDYPRSPELREKIMMCSSLKIKKLLEKKDYTSALGVYRRLKGAGLRITPEIIDLFDRSVRDIYRQAYLLEDVDPDTAMAIYRKIVATTPPESEYHQKAEERLR